MSNKLFLRKKYAEYWRGFVVMIIWLHKKRKLNAKVTFGMMCKIKTPGYLIFINTYRA